MPSRCNLENMDWYLEDVFVYIYKFCMIESVAVLMMVFLQVIVKFIRKSKVLQEYWVVSEDFGQVPREVYLLRTLSHPNIVKVT